MKLPLPLTEIVGSIADDLPESESQAFTAAITAAARGKDLSTAHWVFLAGELRALPKRIPKRIKSVVDEVIAGIDRLAAGKAWPKAGAVAYDAAITARSADYAAFYAAKAVSYGAAQSAAYAAHAAHAAAYAAAAGVVKAAAAAAAAVADYAFYVDDYIAAYTAARQRAALLEVIDSAPNYEAKGVCK